MLRLALDLCLPDDYVTKTGAIFAQRRKGKTYTAKVIAEELLKARLPWVVLDPTGAWWGLRASADGKKPGLPVIILGGKHGDIPIGPNDGKAVAELVVTHPGWYVIDMSEDFDTRAAERKFAAEFADALYRLKGKAGNDFPLHLFVDEADMFVPQDREKGDLPVLGAFQAIVRRGGLRGLGTTLISQRPALVNKSVLVQLDILFVLRLIAGNDQDYVRDNYLKRAGTKEQVDAVMSSWASLALGECWVWEPGEDLFVRVRIREGETFNSSATPKPGERRIEPKEFAKVDLDAVRDQMAATVERVKAMDPVELNRRIKELERQLASKEVVQAPPQIVEVEVIPKAVLKLVEKLRDASMAAGAAESDAAAAYKIIDGCVTEIEALRKTEPARREALVTTAKNWADPARRRELASEITGAIAAPPKPAGDGESLPGPQRKLLTVLATYGPRTRRQLAMQSGYVQTGGAFKNPLGALRSAGYVTRAEPMAITEAGLEALGDFEPLPSGQALIDHWLGSLPGPERKILAAVIDRFRSNGRPHGRDELAADVGYEPTGGAFKNPLGRLRTLELVTKGQEITLTEDFASAIFS